MTGQNKNGPFLHQGIPRCVQNYHGPRNAPSIRFKNLLESNIVLFTITTEPMLFAG